MLRDAQTASPPNTGHKTCGLGNHDTTEVGERRDGGREDRWGEEGGMGG